MLPTVRQFRRPMEARSSGGLLKSRHLLEGIADSIAASHKPVMLTEHVSALIAYRAPEFISRSFANVSNKVIAKARRRFW